MFRPFIMSKYIQHDNEVPSWLGAGLIAQKLIAKGEYTRLIPLYS